MRRVVADTNVLVSAIQFGGKPKQLLDLASDGHVDLAEIDEQGVGVLFRQHLDRRLGHPAVPFAVTFAVAVAAQPAAFAVGKNELLKRLPAH